MVDENNELTNYIEDTKKLKKDSAIGFLWRFIQNTSSQLISFVIQIVLARILAPEDFGLITITAVFITISNVFVQNGLTSALIQKKEIDECEKSSLFYLSVCIGVFLYIVIFLCSPLIAQFYHIEEITNILRVQSIALVFSSLSSVSVALIQRELKFKKTFLISLIGYIFQGTIGITMAYNGFGVWALVVGTLSYNIIYSIGNIIFCKWVPKLVFSFNKVKRMIAFSGNILFSNLVSAIFISCRSLIVGKCYDSKTLGFYDRGNQFPTVVMSGFDGALSMVLYSSLSKIQEDRERLTRYLRKSIKISLTISVPLMFGLAAVAKPTVLLLLTEKWIDCVPFFMISCFICLMWPLSAKTHALNSIGKSKVTFIVNLSSVFLNIIIMFVCVRFGIMVFAIGTLIGNFIGVIMSSIITHIYLGYTIKEQLFDCIPVYFVGFAMFIVVYFILYYLNFSPIFQLLITIPIGVAIYFLLSYIFKLEGFIYILSIVKKIIVRSKNDD